MTDFVVHSEIPASECPCEACDCFPSDCCVDWNNSYAGDGMCEEGGGTDTLFSCNGADCDPAIDACMEFITGNAGKFCAGDFLTITMTTDGINNGGTAGGNSPAIGLFAGYEDCLSSWGMWRVADYSPSYGSPVVTEGFGGAGVEWTGFDPAAGFPDDEYQVTFWWDPSGECPEAGEPCNNYLIEIYGVAGRVGPSTHLYLGSDPRTCDTGPTEPVESVDESGTTVIAMPTQVIRVPMEDCPCDCFEVNPCDCPELASLNVWGGVVARRCEWLQDTSGAGNLWWVSGVKRGEFPGSTTIYSGQEVYEFQVNDPINDYQSSFEGVYGCVEGPSGPGVLSAFISGYDMFGDVAGGETDCGGSISCDPYKWFFLPGTSRVVLDKFGYVVTTKSDLNYFPDPSKEVAECCDPDMRNHPCKVLMCANIGGTYTLSSLISEDAFGEGCIFHFYARTTYLDSLRGELANGFSLFPGWGPSEIPTPGSGPSPFCLLTLTVNILPTGISLSNVNIIQSILTSPVVGGIATVKNWATSPTNFFIPNGSASSVCSMFPITINVPIRLRVSSPGLPVVIINLGTLPIRLSFCNLPSSIGDSVPGGPSLLSSDWFFYMVENLGG